MWRPACPAGLGRGSAGGLVAFQVLQSSLVNPEMAGRVTDRVPEFSLRFSCSWEIGDKPVLLAQLFQGGKVLDAVKMRLAWAKKFICVGEIEVQKYGAALLQVP